MWTPPPAERPWTETDRQLAGTLQRRFGDAVRALSPTSDMAAFEVASSSIREVLSFLKKDALPQFRRLDDLTAIDESARRHHPTDRDFTLVYHLLAFDPPTRLRLTIPLTGELPSVPSVTGIWPSAAWYEREVYDMFGIGFEGHPDLRRILMPDHWQGHPLRKTHPGRATEMEPYTQADARRLQPRDGGFFVRDADGRQDLIVNVGPHHVSTHGLIRYVLALDGEAISDMDIEIGYHHRAAEKIGERQTWHQFIPYTDRVDYLAGTSNNLPYVLAVEKLAGINVPARAQCIRVLLSELFRLSNHLLWLGTYAHDVGAMTPTFYTFREREMILDIIERITGGRLHPSWFRIGGVAADLPEGWKAAVDAFTQVFSKRMDEYEALITRNPIFRARTVGVGAISLDDALDWGISGPNLRACGLAWDLRKAFPYSGYDQFDFDIPTAEGGDCYARYLVRVEEMRQSLDIIRQAADLQTVADLSTQITSIQDPQELMETLVKETQQRFELYHCHIFLVDESGKNLSIRDIETLAHGYFKGSDELRRQIKSGNIIWALSRLKDTSVNAGDCTELERQMLREFEITQKYMQRVTCKSQDKRVKRRY